jgi:hypothetical protein
MTETSPVDHASEAEWFLGGIPTAGFLDVDQRIAVAQVHATLAVADGLRPARQSLDRGLDRRIGKRIADHCGAVHENNPDYWDGVGRDVLDLIGEGQ